MLLFSMICLYNIDVKIQYTMDIIFLQNLDNRIIGVGRINMLSDFLILASLVEGDERVKHG